MAISGYPRGHKVSVPTAHRARSHGLILPRTERLQNPIDHRRRETHEMGGLFSAMLKLLMLWLFGIETHSFLPHG